MMLSCAFLLQSCTVKENLEDITAHAAEILENLASLTQTVDSKVETGQLSKELGDLLDDRIENLSQTIEDLMVDGGGFVFDEVNGTIDNTFDNVQDLVDDLNEKILLGSLPYNIQLLSNELLIQSNSIASHASDLINLTFGNTSILISQATNALLTTIAWVIFGVGLLLIILVLVIFGSRMNRGVLSFVIVLTSIFMVVPIAFLFIPPVKGLVLKSLDVGEEIVARSLQPKLLGMRPAQFEMGTDRKITLFGTHLDNLSLDSIQIGLYQSGNKKVTFSKNSIKVMTNNKIVISDFAKSNLNWGVYRYAKFNENYLKLTNKVLPTTYKTYAINENLLRFGTRNQIKMTKVGTTIQIGDYIKPDVVIKPGRFVQPVQPKSLQSNQRLSQQSNIPIKASVLKNLMKRRYNIAEGDYELRLYKMGAAEAIKDVQHLVISYPPPPPPKPDVFPIEVKWANGNPVKGEKARVRVKLGVIHGEEANSNIKIVLSSTASLGRLPEFTVSKEKLKAATNGFITLTSREFTVNQAGAFNVKAIVDAQSQLSESNEANNEKIQSLKVRDYSFQATVSLDKFVSTKNFDSWPSNPDDYRIDITTSVPGHPSWKVDYNKGGEPNQMYSINKSRTFSNLPEGSIISIHVSGKEADSGANGGDDQMGSKTMPHPLSNQTNGSIPVKVEATHFFVTGMITYKKVIKN